MKLNSINRESIGGAHALDLKTYLYLTPIAVLLSPLLLSNISDRHVATLWLVSSAMAYGVLVAWIALARLVLVSYYRNKNFSIWSLVIVGAAAGLIRQTLTNSFASFYDLNTSETNSVLQNGLLGSLSWMFIVPLLAALTNSLYRLNTFHQEATSTLLQVEATKFSNQEAILKVKATAREQVENVLSDLLSVTRQQILNFQHEPLEVQFEKISQVLTQSAIEIVRPLSHQLSTDTVRVDSGLRFRDVAAESLRSNPFLIWSNSFLIAFGTLLTISREKLSIMSTVIVCLSQFVLVGCTMYLARRAQRRTKNHGFLLLFLDATPVQLPISNLSVERFGHTIWTNRIQVAIPNQQTATTRPLQDADGVEPLWSNFIQKDFHAKQTHSLPQILGDFSFTRAICL